MINPATGLEDPNYIKPPVTGGGTGADGLVAYPSSGLINKNTQPVVPPWEPDTSTPPAPTPTPIIPKPPRVLGVSDPTTTATPTPWNVTKSQSVAEQVRGLINTNSPLQQQAETRANQQMNSRGLLSSSAAVGAGQDAVINSALPIAVADAQINARAAEFNASANNKFKEISTSQDYDLTKMNKQAQNSLTMFDAQTIADVEKAARDQGYTLDKMSAQQLNDVRKIVVLEKYSVTSKLADRETQLAVNQLLVDNKKLVDTMSSGQKAVSDYNNAISAIANNKDLSSTIDPITGKSPRMIAMRNAAEALSTSLSVIQAITGTDIIKLAGLTFDIPVGGAVGAPPPTLPPLPPSVSVGNRNVVDSVFPGVGSAIRRLF